MKQAFDWLQRRELGSNRRQTEADVAAARAADLGREKPMQREAAPRGAAQTAPPAASAPRPAATSPEDPRLRQAFARPAPGTDPLRAPASGAVQRLRDTLLGGSSAMPMAGALAALAEAHAT